MRKLFALLPLLAASTLGQAEAPAAGDLLSEEDSPRRLLGAQNGKDDGQSE
jgi:hypothetical protein